MYHASPLYYSSNVGKRKADDIVEPEPVGHGQNQKLYPVPLTLPKTSGTYSDATKA